MNTGNTLGKQLALISGPVLFFIFHFFISFGETTQAPTMAGIMLWMAVWWVAESVPLGITALLPIVLFPMTGVMDTKEVTPHYGNHIIFLFLGGFLVAYAMEKWDLHKRIALGIIKQTGTSPHRILLGFMLSSYLLSMWISNTATTMMLIPPAIATASQLENLESKKTKLFNVFLFLGIAYSSSIGGISTLVGTPPNLIFYNFYNTYLTDQFNISFFNWMLFALPTSLLFFVIVYWYFKFHLRNTTLNINPKIIYETYTALGPISWEQKIVAYVFSALAITWMTRSDIDFNSFVIPGWNRFFPSKIEDSSVAVFFALVLFVIPSKNQKGNYLLSIKELKKIPMNILLLFGGGFALAQGVVSSGLGDFLASLMGGFQSLPSVVLVGVICLLLLFFTEISSNSAALQLALPILLPLSQGLDIPSWMILIPSTIACSFAFMLPISTPPNAIIFESGRVEVKDMVRYGFILNLIGIAVLLIATFGWGGFIFG